MLPRRPPSPRKRRWPPPSGCNGGPLPGLWIWHPRARSAAPEPVLRARPRDGLFQELAMRKALLRAKGEKVHDDLGRLRKAQKALDLKKKKGKEKWAERKEHDLRQVKEQQEKRRENLQGRRSKKKEAGKKRAGFEGKSSGFLNSEK
ncbi:unnamed protein product [Prorocentrum cordatum]|uniref:Ribosomal RNA-processing protein 14/surfeit locus protein 6 C-terminal domain-containing protein n=1 Tax=Prorocentrum cordatum TaxID=2364126 RepID=A0ABN9U4I3_9DINO|nr:unnamed protein product [Polarella glacialis]